MCGCNETASFQLARSLNSDFEVAVSAAIFILVLFFLMLYSSLYPPHQLLSLTSDSSLCIGILLWGRDAGLGLNTVIGSLEMGGTKKLIGRGRSLTGLIGAFS